MIYSLALFSNNALKLCLKRGFCIVSILLIQVFFMNSSLWAAIENNSKNNSGNKSKSNSKSKTIINKPRFLVENEPIPYLLSLEASYEPAFESNGETIGGIEKYNIDGLPLPIVINDKLMFLAGGGYVTDQWYNSGVLHGAYMSLFLTASIGEKFYFRTYQSAGVFGDNSFSNENLPWKYFQFTEAGYKINSNLALDIGFLAITKFNRNLLLPLLGLTFSWKKGVLDLVAPDHASIRFFLTSEFHAILKGVFTSKDYKTSTTIYSFDSFSSVFQLEYNISGWFWLKSSLSYHKILGYYESSQNIGYPDNWTIQVGLEIRPDL